VPAPALTHHHHSILPVLSPAVAFPVVEDILHQLQPARARTAPLFVLDQTRHQFPVAARLSILRSRMRRAVPYPLDTYSFLKLAAQVGLREARILSRIPSSFLGEMYAGIGLLP